MKTGAMVACSVALGGIVAGASSASRQALDVYAQAMGLAFQVVDDILDVTADSASLGKTPGKDAAENKPTYVSLLGLDEARAFAGNCARPRWRRWNRWATRARAWPSWPISSYFGIADPDMPAWLQAGATNCNNSMTTGMTTELLDSIQSPADLRRLDRRELKRLAEELRGFVLESVSKTGGHLSSNLGTVELTLALHQVFDTPHDRIVWDGPSVPSAQDPDRPPRRHGQAASAGRHLRLSQTQRIGIRRLRHRALVHLDLGRAGHGGGLAQRRRAAPASP